jgi:hypothetical protein
VTPESKNHSMKSNYSITPSSSSKHTNSFGAEHAGDVSAVKYRSKAGPTSPMPTSRPNAGPVERSRTPQSNSSSYYSRQSRAFSPAAASHQSAHSQSPLSAPSVFNKSDSLKFDRHGNVRVSLRDKERQRRVTPAVIGDSPLINAVPHRIPATSPTVRPIVPSSMSRRSIDESFAVDERRRHPYVDSRPNDPEQNRLIASRRLPASSSLLPPPPSSSASHVEEANRDVNQKRTQDENRLRSIELTLVNQKKRNDAEGAKPPVTPNCKTTNELLNSAENVRSTKDRTPESNGKVKAVIKNVGEMSPISNSSLFEDEDTIKANVAEDAEPGEILDMVANGAHSIDSVRAINNDKDGERLLGDDPQNFSDWSDADDYELLNRKDILDEIKQKSEEQLETISDDEFDANIEEGGREGVKDQLSGKQVLDILEIDWKSLVEHKEKLDNVTGSARKRFLPGNIFAQIGVSQRLAGVELTQRVRRLCASQSIDTFQEFHHPQGFLHAAIERESKRDQMQQNGASFVSFGGSSDLKYKQFLSVGRTAVRSSFQRLCPPIKIDPLTNVESQPSIQDDQSITDKPSFGTVESFE